MLNKGDSRVTDLPEKESTSKTSKFHLLIPANGPHLQLCRAVVSSTVLGYPIPVFNGWNKTGDLDASVTHLAKVRNVMRYLDSLESAADDDLVLMIDGYDVVFQLPADVLIQRYFSVIEKANAKIAARFGEDSVYAFNRDNAPRQTILFGPEKICYPVDWNRPGCWAIPDIDMPAGAFGPDDGQLSHNLPKWLNSGTIMGPVGDMRELFAATLKRIKDTYDPTHEFSDSDQRYMSDIWGEQEFWRSVDLHNNYFHDDIDPKKIAPEGEPDQIIPTREADQKTEFHVGIDYTSGLFQTRVGSDHVLEHIAFDKSTSKGIGLWTLTSENKIEASNFQPFEIYLPANVVSSLTRLMKSIAPLLKSDPHNAVTKLLLGTNLVTKNVYGLFHCIGEKTYLDDLWYRLWFQEHAKPLLETRVKSANESDVISSAPIDGRRWVVAHNYPSESGTSEQLAGAWMDMDDEWIDWEDLCEPFEKDIFGDRPEER